MPNAKRKCRYKQCGAYKPVETMIKVPLGYFCSPDCAFLYGSDKSMREAEKKAKKAKSEFKRKFYQNDKRHQLELAQKNFNKYIRLRDHNEPCISCGTTSQNITWSAGHYLTVGAHGELRFTEDNCHKQCWWNCNRNKSGDIARYRINLVKKIGIERVEWLEGPHSPVKWELDAVVTLKKYYAAKSRELEMKLKETYA